MKSLEEIRKEALRMLREVQTLGDLEALELTVFGRKQGVLTEVLRSLAAMKEDARKSLGAEANALRHDLEKVFSEKKAEIVRKKRLIDLEQEKIDTSFPSIRREEGHLHPLTQLRMRVERMFQSLGFEVAEGPEVDTEYYNFDALNVPKEHPARDMQDTFWLTEQGLGEKYLPRTHTSSVQVRYMETHEPPFRIIVPGKVFRNESTDASHDVEFWQLEGLMVGKDVSVANLKDILEIFFSKIFSTKVFIRLRPSFFPFTEPSFEFDITCVNCKGKGCSVCKQSGWLELGGAGMVHQNVFASAGYAKGEWQGFAFGMGLDRIAMMKYKIPDVRMFRQNDIRFLGQF
ncbi:MAG: phenylalanine--tRNA ligase subunit alpha [Patescibacteria group bacterium]